MNLERILRSQLRTLAELNRMCAEHDRDRQYLAAKYVGQPHEGGEVTAVKRLQTGRLLLTVAYLATGKSQQYVVTDK